MAKTRQQKEEVIKQTVDAVKEAKSTVIASFNNLAVNDDQALRKDLANQGVSYAVVSKTLLARALKDAGVDAANLDDVYGNVAVASSQDEVLPAKVLNAFSKEHEGYTLVAGYLEQQLIDSNKIADLASLPSKEELVAKTLATINAPITNFVGVLGGTVRSLVYALNAIQAKKA